MEAGHLPVWSSTARRDTSQISRGMERYQFWYNYPIIKKDCISLNTPSLVCPTTKLAWLTFLCPRTLHTHCYNFTAGWMPFYSQTRNFSRSKLRRMWTVIMLAVEKCVITRSLQHPVVVSQLTYTWLACHCQVWHAARRLVREQSHRAAAAWDWRGQGWPWV